MESRNGRCARGIKFAKRSHNEKGALGGLGSATDCGQQSEGLLDDIETGDGGSRSVSGGAL